ncbi:hypothetical protein DM01DRAFT_1338070 [Hesseltinella vesiculosa]|uniref:Peptide hydrolase n=1 Tax=Hesseltinella vesiculosa TaxID=101127 RepID=A0A1X2GBT2_9FUNG|nr:hypothetical protein DM01DRAFT_1338070 [Hesseltinella vesiculosa]
MSARGKGPIDFASMKETRPIQRPGVVWSWLRLLLYCGVAIYLSFQLHYKLPTPKIHHGVHPETDQPEFSEFNAIQTISYLSDTIGYRLVGTVEESQSADYLKSAILSYQQHAAKVPGAPKFEMWVQQESGSHRFDIMDHMVLKAYTNITNIIVRLSCPEADTTFESRSCEDNAVLVNSHYDTTIGSPGATDDGSGTAVMLELIRVMSQRDWTGYRNAIVFLFNGAEETLQDASHAFITMHELKDSIKSVVNIDACGTTGREILFQANSREMIEAYSHVPYPHGTVLANDVFRTGLIISDTDFRQFVQYGNLTGIDMAIYKNSYLYHTHLDTTKNLQPGSIQHLGENTHAILEYLAQNTSLVNIEPTSEIVFFDMHGVLFWVYTWATAFRIQILTVLIAYGFLGYVIYQSSQSSPYRPIPVLVLSYIRSIVAVSVSGVVALVLPMTVAFFLTSDLINRHMVWFRHEWYGLIVFVPMGMVGAYGVQSLFYHLPGPLHVDMEYGTFNSLMATFAGMTLLTTLTGVASSYVCWVYCLVLLVAALINEFFLKPSPAQVKRGAPLVHSLTYAFACLPLAFIYSDNVFALIDLFVPLTGRMGVDTPVDAIISIIFGSIAYMWCLPALAHLHRFGQRVLSRIVIGLLVLQVLILALIVVCGGSATSWAFPYDELHPKRLFIQHLKNLTSGETYLSVAQADHGPYINTILDTVQQELQVAPENRVGLYGLQDWDSIYPFSHFLGGYRFHTSPYIRAHTTDPKLATADKLVDFDAGIYPVLTVHNDHYDPATGVRTMSIYSVLPTYTWSVISFDAHVVGWSIKDEEPLSYATRYTVRHVNGHSDGNGWRLDLSVVVPEEERALAEAGGWKLRVEFTALESENFSGRRQERLVGGVGVLGAIERILPDWTTTTWLSTVMQDWYL